MERSFSVDLDGQSVGKVTVRRQGLYYHFSCRCRLCNDAIYRLTVSCGTACENLGIPVPKDGSFILNTKLPVKKIGEGELHFKLLPKQESPQAAFIPIKPEEPFAYIAQLKASFLELQNGQPGICVSKKQEP